jgi:hypothetical protein
MGPRLSDPVANGAADDMPGLLMYASLFSLLGLATYAFHTQQSLLAVATLMMFYSCWLIRYRRLTPEPPPARSRQVRTRHA